MEPNMELPPVESAEQKLQPDQVQERLVASPENAPSVKGAKQPKTSTTTHSPQIQVTNTPLDPQSAGIPTSDDDMLIADDTDLIEKEWVNKAKQIVEQTKYDPHLQANEMSKFKAQYQKKRYNKDTKVNSG